MVTREVVGTCVSSHPTCAQPRMGGALGLGPPEGLESVR